MLYLKVFLEKFSCDLINFVGYFDDLKFEYYYITLNDYHITYFDNEYSYHGVGYNFLEHLDKYFDYTSDMFDDAFVYIICNDCVIDDLEDMKDLDELDDFLNDNNCMLLIQYVHEMY